MSILSVKNDNVADSSFVNAQKPVPPTISGYSVSGLDDTALDPAGGQTVLLNGTGFQRGATITLNGNAIAVVSFVSSNQLSFTSPALSAGTYTIYVVNADLGTAIYIPGLIYSNLPTWTTGAGSLGSYYETTSISNTVVATGDAPITYSLFSGSLPTGATLYANGVISGTAPVDSGSTTYSFTIEAIDAQLQGSTRSFSLTINTDVVTWTNPVNGAIITLDSGAYSNVLTASDAAGYSIASFTANTLPTGLTLSGNTISGTPTVEGNVTTLLTATAATTGRSATNTITWVVNLGDTYWKYVTTLLSASSPTPLPFNDDVSTNNFAVTINGDTRPNNFNPYQSSYYSAYYDGTGDYLTLPAATSSLYLTGAFTFETWIYPISTGGQIYGNWNNQTGDPWGFFYSTGTFSSGFKIYFYRGNYGSNECALGTTTGLNLNTWNHFAVTRDASNNIYIFLNGVSLSLSTYQSNLSWSNSFSFTNTSAIGIGGTPNYSSFNGYISNVRFVSGTALYTANFTPPTQPLTAISGTSLLTCQSNRFIDNSTNNFTITRNGDTKVSSFIPYTPNPSYSTYGSTYLDGTGDYLTLNPGAGFAFGTGDFTVEFWAYPTSSSSAWYFIDARNASQTTAWAMYYNNTGSAINWYTGTASITLPNITLNTWTHYAYVRSGTTYKFFVNGVQTNTGTDSTNYSVSPTISYIGSRYSLGAGELFTGYLSDIRVVKGTAVYTSAFTPPTQPLSAIANTSLLTCQTNQPANNNVFLDNSTNNFAITRYGNTTQGTFSPYGENWSVYFNGTTDSMVIPANASFAFSGDFTIECWIQTNTFSLDAGGYGRRIWTIQPSGQALAAGLEVYFYNAGATSNVSVQSSTNIINGTIAAANGNWNHIALCRSGTSLKLFVNGVQSGSTYTTSQNYNLGTTYGIVIGATGGATNGWYQGYVSNFRAVNGTALYTTTFTPSTTPLQPISNTVGLVSQSPRFVDNSVINATLTRNGTPSIQKFGPFPGTTLPTPYYSTYIGTTSDYFTIASSSILAFGTGDFTIEFWMYLTTYGTNYPGNILHSGLTGGLGLWLTSANIQITRYNIGGDLIYTGAMPLNSWNHLAFVRSSGTGYIFLNGTQVATGAISTNYSASSFNVGQSTANSPYYISNLRVVKGSAVYTSNFVVPSAPLTAITNTQVLTCQSNTLIDNSSNNYAFTVTTGVKLFTFNPFTVSYSTKQSYTPSVYGGSMYFDGTGDYLEVPANNVFNLGTNNFTVECWAYPLTSGVLTGFVQNWAAGGQFILRKTTTNRPQFVVVIGGVNVITTGTTTTILANTWNHIAAVRNGSTFAVYVNGIADATTSTNSGAIQNTGKVVRIGVEGDLAGPFTGYISDARITNGVALYTANFVPLNAPLQAVKNSVLLVNGTGSGIYDSSENAIFETVGDAKINNFGPYNGSYYSVYFDGTGDYLVTPSNSALSVGTGAFTLETFVYFNQLSGLKGIVGQVTESNSNYSINIYTNGSTLNCTIQNNATSAVSLTSAVVVGQWYHIVLVKDSSNNVSAFVNGTRIGTTTSTTNVTLSSFVIGRVYTNLDNYYGNNYISNTRLVKGSAVYDPTQTTITVPISPLTAISGTSLLTCQSNTFIDNSTNNFTITKNGDASVATQNPFKVNAASSMYFDGTGDRLASNSGPTNSLGSGDFTIEGWIYCSTLPANARVLSQGSYTTGEYMWIMYAAGGADFTEASTARLTFPSGSFGAGKWTYFAIVRSGTGANNLKAYVDGVNVASATSTYNYSATTNTYIGCNPNQSGQDFNGYITDLRITKGVARYTANFTPPITPLNIK